MTHNSGDFVEYSRTTSEAEPDSIGLVLRTSKNDMADGSSQEWVEVVGPLQVHLVPAEQVRKFDEKPESDPKEVTGGTSGDVGGVSAKKSSASKPS